MNRTGTKLRSVCALLLALGMVLSLAGCGGSSFDAAGYVDATMKLVTTGDSKALSAYEGKAVIQDEATYNTELSDAMETMLGASGNITLPDELQSKFADLVKSMFANISYTVGSATPLTDGSAEGYEVPLTIKPLQLNVEDELKQWIDDFQANTSMEDLQKMDTNEIYEKIYGEIADLLTKAIEKKEYGEEKTVSIPVTKNKDGLYALDEEAIAQVMKNSFQTDIDQALS